MHDTCALCPVHCVRIVAPLTQLGQPEGRSRPGSWQWLVMVVNPSTRVIDPSVYTEHSAEKSCHGLILCVYVFCLHLQRTFPIDHADDCVGCNALDVMKKLR